ncbi:MAG: bile acid:sodium symporter family protein [Lentimicrobiaceae bacterium]|nr:bile acid:sodium symporter family protein [Lentimicrobiaceae bacterium]
MIWIVMPILIVLMFLLGTDLNKDSFTNVARNPRAVIIGMTGQLLILPVIAFVLACLLKLPPVYFMGIMLIACCPGGSSSNVFSMLAKGDVALSVTLTAISSIVTMFTIPAIMEFVSNFVSEQSGIDINLPFGKLIVQNIVLLFVPLILGILFRKFYPDTAAKVNKILGKLAFPALMTLALIFFLQYTEEIKANFAVLGITITVLILAAMLCSSLLSRLTKSNTAVRRTIVIEVGMQNAAQAISIASSPFIFNNGEMALPAIIYALLMNVILLIYVAVVKKS